MSLKAFIDAYIDCALWSSTDNSDDTGGSPLDDNYGPEDLDPGTRQAIENECAAFIEANQEDLDATGGTDEQHGHDFWLTRNGHGAGFWDRGYPHDLGKRLTDAAHAYGSVDLYIGDDGKIHSN